LNSAGRTPLFRRHVVQVIGDMEHAILIDPTVIFGSPQWRKN